MFKDAKQGYSIYMLNRKDISVSCGKITNMPIPHFDNRIGAAKMVVDLNVECNGKTTNYVVDDTAEICFAGDIVITMNRECILREIESIKATSESAIKMMDYHKDALVKCDALLKEYSPEYKERSEYSERIIDIESKVDKLTNAVATLVSKLEVR